MISFKNELALSILCISVLLGCSSNKAHDQADIFTKDNQPTLYVWQNRNSHSNNEATLSLVVKAGSLQEKDDQLGFAHFVEHMAFNGTDRFPKSAMQDRLNELGFSIGSHSNAFTTFDHTIYTIQLNDITNERLDAAMELLSQWAFHIEFSSAEVLLEKPVLLEEFRLGESPQNHIQNQVFSAYYSGTKYSERQPIGTSSSIRKTTAQALGRFYRKWYQPNNMAIIASGDFNTKKVQNYFENHFSNEKNRNERATTRFELDAASFPSYQVLADENTNQEQLLLKYFIKVPAVKSESALIEALKWQGALEIWRNRASSQLSKTNRNITWVNNSWNYISPELLEITLSAGFKTGQQKLAVQFLESGRISILEGISGSELNEWKNNILNQERPQQDSAAHLTKEATEHYLKGWPMVGQTKWISLLESQLPKFTELEMTESLRELTSKEPKIWLVGHSSTVQPSHSKLLTWISEADTAEFFERKNNNIADWSISTNETGTITSIEESTHQITTWTLSNGLTVHHKYSNQVPGKVFYSLVGISGLNALTSQESITARLAIPAISLSGLRNLDGTELQQWLSSHSITLSPYYNFFSRGIEASSTNNEVDTLLNLFYISLTEGSITPNAWETVKEQIEHYLKEYKDSPNRDWQTIVSSSLYLDDPALRTMVPKELEHVTLSGIQQVYDAHIKGVQNYTLAIVGDIPVEQIESEILRTVAALPKSDNDSNLATQARNYPSPKSSASLEANGNGTKSASMILRFSVPKPYLTNLTEVELALMTSWVSEELTSAIREKAGLTYNISAVVDGQTIFQDIYTLIISASTDPANTTKLTKELDATLTSLLKLQPSNQRVNNWLDSMNADRKHAINSAKQQAALIAGSELYGRSLAQSFDPLSVSPDFKPEFLQSALQKFLSKDAVRTQLTWLP